MAAPDEVEQRKDGSYEEECAGHDLQTQDAVCLTPPRCEPSPAVASTHVLGRRRLALPASHAVNNCAACDWRSSASSKRQAALTHREDVAQVIVVDVQCGVASQVPHKAGAGTIADAQAGQHISRIADAHCGVAAGCTRESKWETA